MIERNKFIKPHKSVLNTFMIFSLLAAIAGTIIASHWGLTSSACQHIYYDKAKIIWLIIFIMAGFISTSKMALSMQYKFLFNRTENTFSILGKSFFNRQYYIMTTFPLDTIEKTEIVNIKDSTDSVLSLIKKDEKYIYILKSPNIDGVSKLNCSINRFLSGEEPTLSLNFQDNNSSMIIEKIISFIFFSTALWMVVPDNNLIKRMVADNAYWFWHAYIADGLTDSSGFHQGLIPKLQMFIERLIPHLRGL